MALDEHIPGIRVSLGDDDQLWIEQDFSGTVNSVSLHRIHLRYLAEKLGLVSTTDGQALKTIATLTRRMKVLQFRIGHLADFLAQYSDHAHADLDYETDYARCTADLADEFCAELDEVETDLVNGGASPSAGQPMSNECAPDGRLGEMLKATPRAKGEILRGAKSEPRDSSVETLAELGIDKKSTGAKTEPVEDVQMEIPS